MGAYELNLFDIYQLPTLPQQVKNKMKKYSHQLIIAAILVFSLAPAGLAYSAVDKTFNVTVVTDSVDVNPGNGKCADSNGNCSLRAAVMEANALAGADSITLPETHSN